MNTWLSRLMVNPIPVLLSSDLEGPVFFTKSDLLSEAGDTLDPLWELPGARRILKKQLPDGSWPRSGESKHAAINDGLIETWRQMRFLVEMYGFTKEHPQIEKAAQFIFSCQSTEGDLRGILANQYVTYYTGAIMSLLIKAGYQDDPRIEKGFQWLLSMRQDDLGWSIPMITHKFSREEQYRLSSEFMPPIEPGPQQTLLP